MARLRTTAFGIAAIRRTSSGLGTGVAADGWVSTLVSSTAEADHEDMARWYMRALLVVAALACAYAGLAELPGADATTLARPSARIVFVDVGQGDGVAMRIGDKLIVSDVGEDGQGAVDQALERLNWRSTRTIDVAILTHPHDDHVRNYPALARKWRGSLSVLRGREKSWGGAKK